MSPVWKLGGLSGRELLKRTWRQFREDLVPDRSAILSFYFVLALFPLVLLLTSLLGMFLESGPVYQEALREYLSTVLPRSSSTLIDTTLGDIRRHSGALKLSFALLFTWWSASKGMLAIVDGLNIAHGVEESRPWWKKYLVASALTLVSLVLLAFSVLLVIEGKRLTEELTSQAGYGDVVVAVWHAVRWAMLLGVVALAFNLIYMFAPDIERRTWHWATPGTVVGLSLWLLGSFGLKLYLGYFNQYSVTYGSIGAVIILLLWLYLSGIAILVGGEVNSVIEQHAVSSDRDAAREKAALERDATRDVPLTSRSRSFS